MYIIVIGGGKVGYHLSKALVGEGHEVLIVEKDARTCARIEAELGSICFQGDGCEATTLDDIGAARAEVLIAVTGDDEDNLVSCQVAKFRFNVPRTIARINNPKNDRIFRLLGIDSTVNSTDVILAHIEHEVPHHPLVHLMNLTRHGLEIVDVTLPETGPVVGRRLRDVSLPPDTTISLVISPNDGPRVAQPDLILGAGDELLAVTRSQYEADLRRSLTGH